MSARRWWWAASSASSSAIVILLALAVIARYGAHVVGKLVDTRDEEIVVVVFVGLAILTAGVAEQLGVSDAIGAFMIGLILGATSRADRLRTMTHPLRNAFAAIFFFTFGLSIEPGDVLGVAPQIAVAVVVTVVLCLAAGGIAARLHRYGRVAATNIGLTVLSRGEFSLILASLALASGLDARLGPFTAGYVLVLAVVGPLAVSMSERLARHVPRRWFPVPPPPPPPDRDLVRRPAEELEMDVGVASLERLGADLLHVRVSEGSQVHGVLVAELRLPRESTLGMVVRRGTATAPAPDTRLVEGDVLVVFAPPEHRLATERRLRAVHRSGRLARWRGDHGH